MAAINSRGSIKKIIVWSLVFSLLLPCSLNVPILYAQDPITPSNIPVLTIDGWEQGHNDTDLQYIASNYKLLITDGYSYYNSKVPYLRQLNPNLKILAYRDATVIVKNSADWWDITLNHPEWLLKDEQGNWIYEKGYPWNYLLDPANNGWLAYRANQLKEYVNTHGFDGIYLDVVHNWILDGNEATGNGYIYYTARPVNPGTGKLYTNSEWYQANYDFLSLMKQAIGPNKMLIFNGIGTGDRYYRYYSQLRSYVDITDGTIIEGFMRWGNNAASYSKTEASWKKDVDTLAEVARLGKINLGWTGINGNIIATDEEIRTIHLYSLSSYLLAYGGDTYYNFRRTSWTTRYQPYDSLWSLLIGSPLASYYKQDNIYQRDFTNGKVLVNPTDTGQSYKIDLDGFYQTLDGQIVNSVELAPKTGTVLLRYSMPAYTPPDNLSPSPVSPADEEEGLVNKQPVKALNTSIFLKITPRKIRSGQKVLIKGKITAEDKKAIANKKVIIKAKVLRRMKNKKLKYVWVNLGSVITDRYGNFSLKRKVYHDTYFRAEFKGDTSYNASSSKPIKVDVR